MDAIVAGVSPQPCIETGEAGVSGHMLMRPKPCLDPLARPLPLLARGAAFDTRHALSVFCPEKFEAPKGDPPRHARMQATEAQEADLLQCHRQCEFPQSLRERMSA
jgi:hypothetical protein